MKYKVEYNLRGKSVEIYVPASFSVCVWGSVHGIYVKAEFSHEDKQYFAVIFKEKKIVWSAATLVSYYKMAIDTLVDLPVPPMPRNHPLHEDIF